MGYGINVFDIQLSADGKFWHKKGDLLLTLYMSYNWNWCKIGNIFFNKIGKEEKEDVGDYNLWSVRENMCGKRLPNVVKDLETAINEMKSAGIQVGVPDSSNADWAYGNKMSDDDRLRVFLYHLTSFHKQILAIAKAHPDALFVSDAYFYGESADILIDGKPYIPNKHIKEDQKETKEIGPMHHSRIKVPKGIFYYTNDDGNVVIGVRHPIKGMIDVMTYEDAMYMYGYFLKQDDERAGLWHNLALQLPGAP